MQELADLTVKAFDLADQYRMVVIVLGDGFIGQMSEPITLPEPSGRTFDKSAWALTGAKGRETHLIASMRLTPEDALEKLNLRLQAKYRQIEEKEPLWEEQQVSDAEVLLVGFGLSARICRAAVTALRRAGIAAGLFRPITLWPFPSPALARAARGKRRVLVVEMNAGQMVEDVRLAVGDERTGGLPGHPRRHHSRGGPDRRKDQGTCPLRPRPRRSCTTGRARSASGPITIARAAGTASSTSCWRRCIDELGIQERTILIAPVGCSVLAYNYLKVDGCEAAHGRAPAVATGVKRVHPDRIVISYQGDGDLLAIGTGETIHAANRGEKITVIFVNNAIYGMTGGQMAPTTLQAQKTKTSPYGRNPAEAGFPIRACELLATLDAPVFIERCAVNSVKAVLKTRRAIMKGLRNQVEGKGYSFIEILSMCPTGWGIEPREAAAWIDQAMVPVFPLGNLRDR